MGTPRGVDRGPIRGWRAGGLPRDRRVGPARGVRSRVGTGLGKMGANTFRGRDGRQWKQTTRIPGGRRAPRSGEGAGRTWRKAEVTEAHACVSEGSISRVPGVRAWV